MDLRALSYFVAVAAVELVNMKPPVPWYPAGGPRHGLAGRVMCRRGEPRAREGFLCVVVPEPVLTRFEALHDGGWPVAFQCAVACCDGEVSQQPDVPAFGAAAQVHPPPAGGVALHAAGPAGRHRRQLPHRESRLIGPFTRHGDRLDDSADRDAGALVELADRRGRWSLIHREDHLLAGDESAAEVANVRSLGAHLSHHSSAPLKSLEKQLARHARPVTLDQVRGHAGPPFSGDATAIRGKVKIP